MCEQGLISPKKDYSTGELLVGACSVAQGTFLLIDETPLEAGQLVEQGVKNVQALHSLIGAKELVAGNDIAFSDRLVLDVTPGSDYGFYPITLPLDATTLMISKVLPSRCCSRLFLNRLNRAKACGRQTPQCNCSQVSQMAASIQPTSTDN